MKAVAKSTSTLALKGRGFKLRRSASQLFQPVILSEAKDLCTRWWRRCTGKMHRSFAANTAAQDDKRIAGVARIVVATLREIFDESAYARFLRRTQTQSSPEAYAAFWREREAGQKPRPRCC